MGDRPSRWTLALAALFAAAALAHGCGGSNNGGGPPDSGPPDSGVPDSGTPDSGTPDGGGDAGPDGGSDGGSDAGTPHVNGCTDGAYTDRTGAGDVRTVTFQNFSYAPKCLLIAAGQTVTFSGAFTFHPLEPGVAASATGSSQGSPNNPILTTRNGATRDFAFAASGVYPYYCGQHENLGMYGAVKVQ